MIDKGYINFNSNNYDDYNNFYVKEPCKILEYLTGVKWTVSKEQADYKIKSNDYVIEFWSRDNGKSGHFARTCKGFNSLQKSYSVDLGKIHTYRIFKVVK